MTMERREKGERRRRASRMTGHDEGRWKNTIAQEVCDDGGRVNVQIETRNKSRKKKSLCGSELSTDYHNRRLENQERDRTFHKHGN